jgi:hypothetical protein
VLTYPCEQQRSSDSYFTSIRCVLFAGYTQGHVVDPRVVIPPTGGATYTYGFWMHSTDGGRSGYIQPGWLAAC